MSCGLSSCFKCLNITNKTVKKKENESYNYNKSNDNKNSNNCKKIKK